MPLVAFDRLPDTARLWIFAASRRVTGGEAAALLGATDAFLEQWAAHGRPLTAARDWRHDRFLFVAVDEAAAGVSGCSIDALVRSLRQLEAELDVTLVDHGSVHFRDDGDIRRASRPEFAEMASSGAVTLETPVFDNTLQTVGALREGRWEVPVGDAWHAQAFF